MRSLTRVMGIGWRMGGSSGSYTSCSSLASLLWKELSSSITCFARRATVGLMPPAAVRYARQVSAPSSMSHTSRMAQST